jgi:hypothetical protein
MLLLDGKRWLAAVATLAVALAAVGCADLDTPLGPEIRPVSMLRVTGLTPSTVTRGQTATIVATGLGFLPDLTAFVGLTPREDPEFYKTQLRSVEFVSTTRALLYLPVTLPAGDLDVTFINPDSGMLRLPGALHVVRPGQIGIEGPQGKTAQEEPCR